MGKFIDLSGQRFGRLLVLHATGVTDRHGSHLWVVACDCGTQKTVTSGRLRSKNTRSCGCLNSIANRKRLLTHGQCKTPEYAAWARMNQRCHTEYHLDYPDYGGRGIKVCDRWRHDFLAFLADMGKRPSPDHSLDRIDVNGDYTPDNCRWATDKEQCRNRRSNVTLTLNGVTKSAPDWADELGLPASMIRRRLMRGWTDEQTLRTPRLRW